MLKEWYNILSKRFPDVELVVTGTYALQIQGIDLGRKPADLDLMISHSHKTGIIEKYRRFFRFLYKYKGPYIDWMEEKWDTNDDDYVTVDGILCSSVDGVIRAKHLLIDSGRLPDWKVEKHQKDIAEIERQLKTEG